MALIPAAATPPGGQGGKLPDHQARIARPQEFIIQDYVKARELVLKF